MRSLKEVFPPYQERVNFVLVGMDMAETPQQLEAYRQEQGYPWEVMVGNRDLLARYNVLTTATKFVVGADGVIVARDGYGVKPAEAWRQVLDEVSRR